MSLMHMYDTCRLLMLITAAACMAKDTGVGFLAGVVAAVITADWIAAWRRFRNWARSVQERKQGGAGQQESAFP